MRNVGKVPHADNDAEQVAARPTSSCRWKATDRRGLRGIPESKSVPSESRKRYCKSKFKASRATIAPFDPVPYHFSIEFFNYRGLRQTFHPRIHLHRILRFFENQPLNCNEYGPATVPAPTQRSPTRVQRYPFRVAMLSICARPP
uniref:Uncharacterized protein n=1 Tax=Vespula pensylvanica TaxID=30213 RepID=A0A834JYY2_VESPE|nr:hypothetical protein H0235_016781 [Vespula pensylvanica]